jgi:hypothetical protein
VHDFERVQDANPHDDLLSDFGSVELLEVFVVLDELEEVLALDEFSDDVDVGFGLDALLELKQQRVAHRLHDTALVAE